jgi:hypothetical protein
VPDVLPSLRLVGGLRTPLLVLHGEHDTIVPLRQGQALFTAAPEPKALHVFPGLGHNDLVTRAGEDYATVIADWWTAAGRA